MKRMLPSLPALVAALVIAGAGVSAAEAACRVVYKAKSDNPLSLYYDSAVLPGPCDEAEMRLSQMLAAQGRQLLKILSAQPQ